MKLFLLLIFSSACIHSFSQAPEFDMGKASVYCESYPAKENFSGQVLQGTGFITQYQQRFYFITNYHNVVNHNFYTGTKATIEVPYEKIRLILKRKTDNEWGELFIKLIKEDSTNNFYRTKYNDDDADIMPFQQAI